MAVSLLVPAKPRRVGQMIRHGADWRAIARRLALEKPDLKVQLGAQLDELRHSRAPGLEGLSDRVAAVGGRLSVQSNLSHGTRLHVAVPCASANKGRPALEFPQTS
jgi:glucose-6-phosphate-specific signal transduction histidine kinase